MKYLAGLVLLLSIAFEFRAEPPHKFYFTNTLIEGNQRTQMIEITIKLFTDDLEKAIQLSGHPEFRIGDADDSNVSHLIQTYLQQHFALKFQGNITQLSYVGQELENDLTICYFELGVIQDYTFVEIKNDILLEVYQEQRNVVDFRLNGKTQTLLFFQGKTSEMLYK